MREKTMPVVVKLLEKPTYAQIEEAVGVMTRAFDGEPSVDSMTGGNSDLRIPLFRSMIRAGAIEGAFYAVTDSSDKILSIGIWFGPGQQMFASEIQQKEGWTNFFAALKPEIQEWWTKVFYPLHDNAMKEFIGADYADSWFANVIATDPKHQRKGYASALVRTVCERSTKEKKSAVLATQNDKNVEWYKKLGFRLKGKIVIPSDFCEIPDSILSYEAPESS